MGEIIADITEFFQTITEFVQVANDNVWFSLLFMLGFTIYMAFLVSRIINIKHENTAEFMNKVEDVVYGIEGRSSSLWVGIWKSAEKYHQVAECRDCIHPIGSFTGTLHSALFLGTVQRIKSARRRIKWHKLSQHEYDVELEKLGSRLRNQSQYDLRTFSRGQGELIEETNDQRYSKEHSLRDLREIMDEAIRLDKKEKKQIIKTIFWWKELMK